MPRTKTSTPKTAKETPFPLPVAAETTDPVDASPAGVATPPRASDTTGPRWAEPYRAVFTCPAAKFELGENRQFKQMVFTFGEKPELAILDALKEAGFTYRPREKAWTIATSASSRELANRMALEWAQPRQGVSR